MREWYYSGLQGLCVSLAGHSSAFDGSASASALIARELFNDDDRFDSASNVSRTWRLSPPRRARMFEERWARMAESVRAADDVRAVLGCVAFLRESEEFFLIREAFSLAEDASAMVRDDILPAMESGFTTERYPQYAIRAFSDDARAIAARIDRADTESVSVVLIRLIAAAIYGPLHVLALSSKRAVTELSRSEGSAACAMSDAEGIVVVQASDRSLSRVCNVRVFEPNTAVFVGRSARLERYEQAACDFSGILQGKSRELFHLSEEFRRVSACHCVLVEEDGCWMYYDLDSTNGAVVENDDGLADAAPVCMLKPGDFLWLGISELEAGSGIAANRSALLKISEYTRSFIGDSGASGASDGR